MLQGFKNLLSQTNKIIAEECGELKMNDPDIRFDMQIEKIAIHNLKSNLELLISEIEARKLDNIKLECRNIDNDERFDFNSLIFLDYDFNLILQVIKEVKEKLKKYYLPYDKLKYMQDNEDNTDPKELFLTFNFIGIYDLLTHILDSNRIFFNLYESIQQNTKDRLEIKIFIMERENENN